MAMRFLMKSHMKHHMHGGTAMQPTGIRGREDWHSTRGWCPTERGGPERSGRGRCGS
jgi:hypothetical protein